MFNLQLLNLTLLSLNVFTFNIKFLVFVIKWIIGLYYIA